MLVDDLLTDARATFSSAVYAAIRRANQLQAPGVSVKKLASSPPKADLVIAAVRRCLTSSLPIAAASVSSSMP